MDLIPEYILGGAWVPVEERMKSGIYFPLFLVLFSKKSSENMAIYYLSADLQKPEMFRVRKPLSSTAKRVGWQGFIYDLSEVKNSFIRIS